MMRLKSPNEILKIEHASKIVAEVLSMLSEYVVEGSDASVLERKALEHMAKRSAKPAFMGYRGYGFALTVSINEEVVHGLPLKEKVFGAGDIVSVDCGVVKSGYIGDAAYTYVVKDFRDEADEVLVKETHRALYIGIEAAKPGNRVGDIGHAIQTHVESFNLSVIRDYVGHGVGAFLHEDPQIPNYGKAGTGPIIREGMTLAIEPMISRGDYSVVVLEDGWTAVTTDRSTAAHFEHTVVVEEKGARILSTLDGGVQ
ncbi:MAG TPA: type I methionyl aminopeptidase [Kosmotogaceae bacterium]|nr:MAG: Methionine aminopeptidase [Thermotogales bacterium 46_20]HAA85282.1 type I methionyl aminopeptidase [Kosmotogaceae bacterium]